MDLLQGYINSEPQLESNTFTADPTLPFTIVDARQGDAEFTVGGDDTVGLTLILSEGQVVERMRGGV